MVNTMGFFDWFGCCAAPAATNDQPEEVLVGTTPADLLDWGYVAISEDGYNRYLGLYRRYNKEHNESGLYSLVINGETKYFVNPSFFDKYQEDLVPDKLSTQTWDEYEQSEVDKCHAQKQIDDPLNNGYVPIDDIPHLYNKYKDTNQGDLPRGVMYLIKDGKKEYFVNEKTLVNEGYVKIDYDPANIRQNPWLLDRSVIIVVNNAIGTYYLPR